MARNILPASLIMKKAYFVLHNNYICLLAFYSKTHVHYCSYYQKSITEKSAIAKLA